MMQNYIRPALVAAIVLLGPSGASAETPKPSGSNAAEFSLAVDQWLAGEDISALSALAALARQNNRAAQILLARIAARGNLHAHATEGLQRDDRVALLRKPGGLSGKSWLTEAEKDEPLATALLQSTESGQKGPAIAALIDLGETQTALIAAQTMLLQGEAQELIDVLQGLDDKLPDEAAPLLAWALAQADSGGSGRYVGSARVASLFFDTATTSTAEMTWVTTPPGMISDDKKLLAAMIKAIPDVESWTPMRQFCDRQCPETRDTCTAVGVSLLAALGPFPMRSPSESLISNVEYWASVRIEGDLMRSIADLAAYGDQFDSVDACFFTTGTELQAVYGARK